MANSIFDDNSVDNVTENPNIFEAPEVSSDNNQTTVISHDDDVDENSKEIIYSQEELNDPNLINVSIADEKTPLVILFGPPTCGKTMTLLRLTRYLNKKGYEVSPIRNFRPAYDTNYTRICKGFDTLICSDDAAEGTQKVNFMLVQVMKNGNRICQLLEAPGEHYFNSKDPNAPFVNYINTIISKPNRKIWCIMTEPSETDTLSESDRKNYVKKIHRLKTKMRPRDKVIVVFNKVDQTSFVVGPGKIHESSAIQEVKNLYPGIFVPFANVNPITKLWRAYNCKFVPFQTGDYSKSASGKQTFQEGPEEYPYNLWNKIMGLIHG